MYHSFFIYSSVSGHLPHFRILTVVNSVTMNVRVHVSFQITALFSSEKPPEVKLPDPKVVLVLIFWGTSIISFIVTTSIYIPINTHYLTFQFRISLFLQHKTVSFMYLTVDIFLIYLIWIMSNSLWHQGLYSPWNSPGQNTGGGSLYLLQGAFPTQGSNPGLPHCRWILYQLSHREAQEYRSG